jgi:hypothetical protein
MVKIKAGPPHDRLHDGKPANVVLTYTPRGSVSEQTVLLISGAELFAIEADQRSLDPVGLPLRWEYSLLMTDAQAELIDLAQRVQSSMLNLSPDDSVFATPEAASVDPALIERLKQEVAPADQPGAEASS